MAERLFCAIFFTAITTILWITHVPELCAVAIVTGCLAFGCWIAVTRLLDKKQFMTLISFPLPAIFALIVVLGMLVLAVVGAIEQNKHESDPFD